MDNQNLSAEKFIPGHSRVRLWIGPLSPGKYPLSGEFHLFGNLYLKTAQGRLLVK